MTLTYKGYTADIEPAEDGTRIVAIAGIKDIITTEVAAGSPVGDAFRALVDEYLATCKEIAKAPDAPAV